MRQRIHAGAGGDEGRHADRELGIGDDDRRQQLRMEDDLLGVRCLVGDDAGAADFGAGAGGRRHRDDRRDRVGIGARPPVADVLEIPHRPRLSGLEGDQLAEIERRAAAEGDDAVMLALLEGGDAGGEVGLDRVGLDVGKHRMRHLGVVEDLQRARDHRQLGKAGIGDEQRPLDAGRGKRVGQFGNAARAEADGGRIVPFGRRHHRLLHEGGFTLEAQADGSPIFRRPDGRPIAALPAVPRNRRPGISPIRDVARNGGHQITAETVRSRSNGGSFDLDLTVDVLCQRHRTLPKRAGPPDGD